MNAHIENKEGSLHYAEELLATLPDVTASVR
jgi:hypothetical protein